ncbi:putative bifunctional diguanylate cyclase/phosphodiesterase [Paenibacillus spiritus]|nr:GGDEF domain-containing phosphodiesterase [Paenibacillus spiritus]
MYNRIHILNHRIRSVAIYLIGLSFIAGAAINYAFQYHMKDGPLHAVLLNSGILVLLGTLIMGIFYSGLRSRTVLVGIIIALSIPIITLRFADCAGVTIWAFPFLFLILMMVVTNRAIFALLSLSILTTQILMWAAQPKLTVEINGADHLGRIAFFVAGIISAYFVNKSYIERLRENHEQLRQIEKLAYRDHLTGLPNLVQFSRMLEERLANDAPRRQGAAVVLLDVDEFKLINDTLGHDKGDRLLLEASKRLVGAVQGAEMVARMGGDVFLVLLELEPERMKERYEALLQCFRTPFQIDDQEIEVTASVGVTVYPEDGVTAAQLTKNAEIAMYEAKNRGKNQIAECTPGLRSKVEVTVGMMRQLLRAQERNELELFYQPQVCCGTGAVVGLEALIRWRHPEKGMIPPGLFIPVAEQTGLILPIGEWVLRTACERNKAWQDAGLPPVRIGVNLSVRQLQNPGIVDTVKAALRDSGLEPRYLELEITESVVMKGTDTIETINRLKELGVYISIDDFGTEYSSLNYLRSLDVDRIKIAMPFVQGVEESRKDRAITKGIIVLAKTMGLGVIAEGVETRTQLDYVTEHGCDEVQGYYYYKPLPSAEMEELLRQQGLSERLVTLGRTGHSADGSARS